MGKIDSAGTYRGEITEASLGETKKGYPQFVARIKATEKYVEESSELEHFGEQGILDHSENGTYPAQWVDWSSFDESTTAFLVLFNNPDEFSEATSLANYHQLRLAVDWDGTEFESLNDDTHVGKTVLIRVEEEEYNGQRQFKVNWIDAHDASPTRELRKLDSDKVKSLASKLKVGGKKAKPAKASKPAAKPTAKTEEKKTAPPKKAKKTEEPEAESADELVAEEAESGTTQEKAWNFVCENKGDNSDTDVEDAWIAACEAVGGDKDEDDFTDEEWAKVRDHVKDALSL